MQVHLLFTRAQQLIDVEVEAIEHQLEDRFTAIKSQNSAAGKLNSGDTLKSLHRAACDELEHRSRVIFEAFARAHAAFMPRSGGMNRADVKAFTRRCIVDQMVKISPVLEAGLRRITDERTIERAALTLSKPANLLAKKLDVEVDLHFDHLEYSST